MNSLHCCIGRAWSMRFAGAGTEDKIVGKGCQAVQIHQENIFPFFLFQGINNGAGNFQGIQKNLLLV